jgi:hypothetical protein
MSELFFNGVILALLLAIAASLLILLSPYSD